MILGPSLGRLGYFIGNHSCISIFISCLIVVASVATLCLLPPKFELGFDDGYTVPDAPSKAENRAQIRFFGDSGNPWYMAIFAVPVHKDGSVIHTTEFYEIEKFYRNIKKEPIRFDKYLNRSINYFDLCGQTCNLNELLFTTYKLSFWGMGYPVAEIFGYKSNIAKHFYNVTTDESGNIVQAKIALLVFMAFTDDDDVRRDLGEFETMVQK
ncbi:unnamed protein product [Caenorhabditis bovis]|uniref:Uncharacterized protein n=1 Tax=Caenorhabditis bovis TaxID=2654633 RepID=A0A8S1ESA8_9PELO|nr:unnamed protein product [Caenorhabditis bovis]